MSGIDVYENQQSALLVLADGVDALTVAKFRHLCDDLLAQGITFFIIDLSQTRTVDSAGIAALVYLYKCCRSVGGAMKIGSRMSPAAQRILRLTRFDRIFEVVDIHRISPAGVRSGDKSSTTEQSTLWNTYESDHQLRLSQNAVVLEWPNGVDTYLQFVYSALRASLQFILNTTVTAFMQRGSRQFSVG